MNTGKLYGYCHFLMKSQLSFKVSFMDNVKPTVALPSGELIHFHGFIKTCDSPWRMENEWTLRCDFPG